MSMRATVRELDTFQNLSSLAVPPCLVTENGAQCDREGTYWLTVRSTDRLTLCYSLGACPEHAAAARELSGTRHATFTVEQVTNHHPYWTDDDLDRYEVGDAPPMTGATDGG